MSNGAVQMADMTSRWRWVARLLFRRIWFRAALFSLFSVAVALLAAFVAPYVPYEISTKIGSDAVDNILGILASSMLAVTTFSLTAMVSAVSGASSTITPRATQLLVEDSTAQNALSTFIGAFLFSIVGICALSTGIYGKAGRVILFIGTVVVIAVIVVTLLRWIGHLASFGRVGDTIDRVEKVTTQAVARSGQAVAFETSVVTPARGERAVFSGKVGYITHIDLAALDSVARRLGCHIHVQAMPGAFVTTTREIARLEGNANCDAEIGEAFTISPHRQFDHDPRLGLVVLSEIASRALSPSVNDPGTAIAVLGSGVRVMSTFLDDASRRAPSTESVRFPSLGVGDLLDDLIRPIARDGAGIVEVAIKLQHSLAQIAAVAPKARGAIALRAEDALVRCEKAMSSSSDLGSVREAYRSHWGAQRSAGAELQAGLAVSS